jgi:hypothetical protein
MESAILVGFALCSSCGIVFSIPFLYLNVKRSKSIPTIAGYSRLERYSAFVFGLMHIDSLAAIDSATAISLYTSQQVLWIDAACFSALQIYAGVNIRALI